jgi:rhodanese-related sulfurtransferase
LSAAIEAGWSPSRLSDVDLAYGPMLGPAVDPLHTAARVAAMTLAGEARPISAEALALRVLRKDEMQVVDVSATSSSSVAWPQGTRAMPLERLREDLGMLAKDKPTVLVSRTGQRAFQAYRILVQRGFTDVVHLDGGWLSYALMAE